MKMKRSSACILQFLTAFLLLTAVGHAAIVYKDIYKDVMPFGLTTVSMFDETTFNANIKSFDSFYKYEGIEIGGVAVSKSRIENYKKQFHIALALFFSTKNDAFYEALMATQAKSKVENMEKVILGTGSAAEKHKAVFTDFFLNKDVIDTIIDLFGVLIIFTFEDMKRWADSPLVNEFVGIDFLGCMATHQQIKNEVIKTEDIKAYTVKAGKKEFIQLVVAMRAIPDSDKDAWCSAYFNLFNGMKATAFQDSILFTDKFDALTIKKNVSAQEYVDFAITTMNEQLKSIKKNKITANLITLDAESNGDVLTRCRMRNYLVAHRRYFGVDVAPKTVFLAFNFQPGTWSNFADIQKTLNEVILLSRTTQIAKFEAIVGFSEKPSSEYKSNSAEELRNAFFAKKGFFFGNNNIFVKVKEQSKRTIFETANDLRIGECLALKQIFKEADFFGFIRLYSFYKSPTFELLPVQGLFTDEQQSKAYHSANFSTLIASFGSLKIDSLNDLIRLLSNVVAKNKKFPDIDILKALKSKSKEALISMDITTVLTAIYDFTIEYCRTKVSSFSALKVRAYSSRIELFLTFAAPFKTENNIFRKRITTNELKNEKFNDINFSTVEASLKQITADVAIAEKTLIAFVAGDIFAEYYKSLVATKKISALSPVTVLTFIGYIDQIAKAIALVGQQDVTLIAEGYAPLYFDTFIGAKFFNVSIPDANSLKREVTFMIEMRDMLINEISALKNIDNSVDLWLSLSSITDPESIYMQHAENQSIVSALKSATSNVEYMNVIRHAFKAFIPVLNKSLQTEGITTKEAIKLFFKRSGELTFDAWIEKLVTLSLFGIPPDADVNDCKVKLRYYGSHGNNSISQKLKDTESTLNLSEITILEFIAKLTLSTSKFWYHYGLDVVRPTKYTDAVAEFAKHYLNLFNYLVIVAGGKKGTQAENEIQLIFSAVPALANTLFADNFFNLKEFSTEKSIPQEIVQANLGFVTSDIEKVFTDESVSVSEEEMLKASANLDFFGKSSNDALKAAWTEFSNTAIITKRIKKLVQSSTADGKSLLQLFVEEWKKSIAISEDEVKEKSGKIVDDIPEVLTKSFPEKEDINPEDEVKEKSSEIADENPEVLIKSGPEKDDINPEKADEDSKTPEKSLKSSDEKDEELPATVVADIVTDKTDSKSETPKPKDPSSTKSAKAGTKLSSTIKFVITITVLAVVLAFSVLAVYLVAWKRRQRLNRRV